MNLQKAENLALKLMRTHSLISWDFCFDRAKTRFGKCNFTQKTISISKHLTELNSEKIVTETILHEIAHAICGPKIGHGKKWKEEVIRLGGTPARCFSTKEINMPKMKFTAKCNSCQREFQASRKRLSACGICCNALNKGKYAKEFRIIFTENC
ncbi:MAG: SprT-like domain-containing protein [Candidatus Peregrinibacteria bacterium]|nr:SprT-like domain-containing protein [Candidatus Peregrinibacteria bacterium]